MAESIKVRIDDRLLQQIIRESPQKATDLVEASAREGQGYVMSSFGSDGSPSSPGGVPGIDTGTLKNSIEVQPTGARSRTITANTDYAEPLEFGTSKMAARPYMLPMAFWLEKRIPNIWGRFIE